MFNVDLWSIQKKKTQKTCTFAVHIHSTGKREKGIKQTRHLQQNNNKNDEMEELECGGRRGARVLLVLIDQDGRVPVHCDYLSR